MDFKESLFMKEEDSPQDSLRYLSMEETVLSGNVPAFLVKLWRLVADSECDNLISWTKNGTTFTVHDPSTFAKDILPKFFKHNKFASFVRQLNMYGFKKVTAVEQGGLKHEKDEWEFHHPHFTKGQIQRLEMVKRKANPEEKKIKSNDLDRIIEEVNKLKGKHDNVKVHMDSLQIENELLWRHVGDLREKHRRQQHVINKLIKFFLSLAYGGKGKGLNHRRRRLAIEGNNSSITKRRKAAATNDIVEASDSNLASGFDYNVESPASLSPCDLDQPDSPVYGPQITVLADDADDIFDRPSVIASSCLPMISETAKETAIPSSSSAPTDTLFTTASTATSSTYATPAVSDCPVRGDIAVTSDPQNMMISKSRKRNRKPSTSSRKKATKLEMPSKALAFNPAKMMSPNTMSLLDSLIFPEENFPSSAGGALEEIQSSTLLPSSAVVSASLPGFERDLDQNLDHISDSLGNLQGLLASGQYNLDTNALNDIFAEYPLDDVSQPVFVLSNQTMLQPQLQKQTNDPSEAQEKDDNEIGDISGQEVVQYTRPFSPGQFMNEFAESIQNDNADSPLNINIESPVNINTDSLLD